MKDRTTIQLSESLRKELRVLASKRDVSYQDLLSDMISVFRELDREKTIVSIPTRLADRINDNIKDTDMSSLSEYITFVLRMILAEKPEKMDIDEKRIKEKLQRLGYI